MIDMKYQSVVCIRVRIVFGKKRRIARPLRFVQPSALLHVYVGLVLPGLKKDTLFYSMRKLAVTAI